MGRCAWASEDVTVHIPFLNEVERAVLEERYFDKIIDFSQLLE